MKLVNAGIENETDIYFKRSVNMKSKLIVLFVILAVFQYQHGQAQAIIVDQATGEYLGNANPNPYDPNSVSNPYGEYGSKYSGKSINNRYGEHGNPYSAGSVNNPYSVGGTYKDSGETGRY